MNDTSYGATWQRAAQGIASVLQSELPEREQLKRVLGLGYFSQFTSHASADFNEAVVAWLERHLAEHHGLRIAQLPASLDELDVVPDATIVGRDGRRVSPDLLRNVAYAMQLAQTWPGRAEPAQVLEIGGGYGALARVLEGFHPRSRFWLTDIPDSLRCCEIYLRAAFPAARIVRYDEGASGEERDADFHLVPVALAPRVLAGRSFDLAINVWSFGEMPNPFTQTWLRLLQRDCRVERLFTINSFLAPVTPESEARTRIGDWLFQLDGEWSIERFEIDPVVHRCPLVRNFPNGIGLLARRMRDEREIAGLREAAAREAQAVLREDWAGIAAFEQSSADAARPERMLDLPAASLEARSVSSRRLAALTDYIGHFEIEPGKEGPFFRLWNDWRLNGSERSGALLVAYLAMVAKSDLERRCTKEELFLLQRLPRMKLHDEYLAFDASRGRIAHGEQRLTDQEACDRALARRSAGDLAEALELWTKVAAAYPAHGDCWFQLAMGMKAEDAPCEAALYAAHAVHLGCDYHAGKAAGLRAAAESALRRSAGLRSADADAAFRTYFAGEPQRALTELAGAKRRAGSATLAAALERAAGRYS
ncbi:MAG TPA: putative sugar O-methyltransferase [Usitatibacter sp.]|nr:putative sugar O-methyltransferase [Usitatibacter sp.]